MAGPDTTPTRSYPRPDPDNPARGDAVRIAQALDMVDADIAALGGRVDALEDRAPVLQEQADRLEGWAESLEGRTTVLEHSGLYALGAPTSTDPNALVVTPVKPIPAGALAPAALLTVAQTNTGPVTITVPPFDPLPLLDPAGRPLKAKALAAGTRVIITKDGAAWRLTGTGGAGFGDFDDVDELAAYTLALSRS